MRRAGALFVLGLAMTLLAVGYLGVQYMLALRELALPVGARRRRGRPRSSLLSGTGLSQLVGFAAVVLALQAAAALSVLALGLARRRRRAPRRPRA